MREQRLLSAIQPAGVHRRLLGGRPFVAQIHLVF